MSSKPERRERPAPTWVWEPVVQTRPTHVFELLGPSVEASVGQLPLTQPLAQPLSAVGA